jgi:hypothetical protein
MHRIARAPTFYEFEKFVKRKVGLARIALDLDTQIYPEGEHQLFERPDNGEMKKDIVAAGREMLGWIRSVPDWRHAVQLHSIPPLWILPIANTAKESNVAQSVALDMAAALYNLSVLDLIDLALIVGSYFDGAHTHPKLGPIAREWVPLGLKVRQRAHALAKTRRGDRALAPPSPLTAGGVLPPLPLVPPLAPVPVPVPQTQAAALGRGLDPELMWDLVWASATEIDHDSEMLSRVCMVVAKVAKGTQPQVAWLRPCRHRAPAVLYSIVKDAAYMRDVWRTVFDLVLRHADTVSVLMEHQKLEVHKKSIKMVFLALDSSAQTQVVMQALKSSFLYVLRPAIQI